MEVRLPLSCHVSNLKDPVNDQVPTKLDGVGKKMITSHLPPMIWVPTERGTLKYSVSYGSLCHYGNFLDDTSYE